MQKQYNRASSDGYTYYGKVRQAMILRLARHGLAVQPFLEYSPEERKIVAREIRNYIHRGAVWWSLFEQIFSTSRNTIRKCR